MTPIMLYPLEVGHVACDNKERVEAKDVTHGEGIRTSDKKSPVDTVRTVRPSRRAARKANDLIRTVMESDSGGEL